MSSAQRCREQTAPPGDISTAIVMQIHAKPAACAFAAAEEHPDQISRLSKHIMRCDQVCLTCKSVVHAEPIAAALATARLTGPPKDELVLVFDLGGGTLDISLLDSFEVCSTFRPHWHQWLQPLHSSTTCMRQRDPSSAVCQAVSGMLRGPETSA